MDSEIAVALTRLGESTDRLLAWLIGRDSGTAVTVEGAAAVPVLPPWR